VRAMPRYEGCQYPCLIQSVIPLVPSLLNWPFLEKKEGKWVSFEPTVKPLIQMAVYAEAFTQDELKKLQMKQKYGK